MMIEVTSPLESPPLSTVDGLAWPQPLPLVAKMPANRPRVGGVCGDAQEVVGVRLVVVGGRAVVAGSA
jgi:hypothetical protein